jgi:hypothetical protein
MVWIGNLALATALMLSRTLNYSYFTWLSTPSTAEMLRNQSATCGPGHIWRWVTPAETGRCGLSQRWGTRICTACISMQTGVTFNETFVFVKLYCRCNCKSRILSQWSGIDFDKQMNSSLGNKFVNFYGAPIMFTRTWHSILSWATWMQSTFSNFMSLGFIWFVTPKNSAGKAVLKNVVNFCLDWMPVT